MAKINVKSAGERLLGLAAGTAGAGMVLNALKNFNLSPLMKGLALAVGGAFLPQIVGGKNASMIQAAGDAVASQGIRAVLVDKFPNMIAGFDDEGDGYGVNGPQSLYELGPGTVSGLGIANDDGYEVSGTGVGANSYVD